MSFELLEAKSRIQKHLNDLVAENKLSTSEVEQLSEDWRFITESISYYETLDIITNDLIYGKTEDLPMH